MELSWIDKGCSSIFTWPQVIQVYMAQTKYLIIDRFLVSMYLLIHQVVVVELPWRDFFSLHYKKIHIWGRCPKIWRCIDQCTILFVTVSISCSTTQNVLNAPWGTYLPKFGSSFLPLSVPLLQKLSTPHQTSLTAAINKV